MTVLSFSTSLCCAAVVALLAIYYTDLDRRVGLGIFTSIYGKDEVDLVIGIMSARGNFQQREALRNTWVGHTQSHPLLGSRVLIKFMVGDKACQIHPEYRTDPFTCNEINITDELGFDHNSKEDVMTSCTQQSMVEDNKDSIQVTFSLEFKVLYPIVLTELGMFKANFSLDYNPTITLYDSWTEEKVISAIFSREEPGVQKGGLLFKEIKQFLLPKGFEGRITLEGLPPQALKHEGYNCCLINEMEGPVLFIKRSKYDMEVMKGGAILQSSKSLSCSLTSFNYHFHDYEELSDLIASKEYKSQVLKEKLQEERLKLEAEIDSYGDIVMTDAIEVYRSLPRKLLKFYTWVITTTHFKFLLKTDDDCYVDPEAIIKVMDNLDLWSVEKAWYSNFRAGWAVDLHGKWAELNYQAPAYPDFACGSGNVLAADLVHWVATNSRDLFTFQGEDVSLGIWLSAVKPTFVQDSRWQCDQICTKNMFTLPENTAQQLHYLWQNKVKCGDPCGCPLTPP